MRLPRFGLALFVSCVSVLDGAGVAPNVVPAYVDYAEALRTVRSARVDYAALKANRDALDRAVTAFAAPAAAEESSWTREQRMAFWINAYNAFTLKLISDEYPITSVWKTRDGGPWGKKLVKVEGEEIALDDIEHRILRPIWKDPRTHYAVNCASLGCPNLQPRAFTASFMEAMLDEGARAYVNHPRGAHVRDDGLLEASSIYKWFVSDFGGERGVLEHLRQYAGAELAQELGGKTEIVDYRYDWSLNDAH